MDLKCNHPGTLHVLEERPFLVECDPLPALHQTSDTEKRQEYSLQATSNSALSAFSQESRQKEKCAVVDLPSNCIDVGI